MSTAVSQCSFCDRPEREVERLAAGLSSVSICNQCLDLCKEIIAEDRDEHPAVAGVPAWEPSDDEREELKRIGEEMGKGGVWDVPIVDGELRTEDAALVTGAGGPEMLEPPRSCAFCGRSVDDFQKLVAGPSVGICDECIRRLG